ncbi:MAG: ABC transporter ATP-binding protein [Hasllibacter sp.]
MSRTFKRSALRRAFSFTFRHWRRTPFGVALVAVTVLLATGADILLPLVTGRLIDAVAGGGDPWGPFGLLLALGAAGVAFKAASFYAIIDLTMAMMREALQDGFARVQRLPAAWHANSFAGSTVRKITRGGWAVDMLNDVLLLALLPSALMLIGTTITLATFSPWLGLTALVGSSVFTVVTVLLSARYVAPAASLSNAQDSRVSGALADAITCNAVVKAHAAEAREDARLALVVDKWRRRTSRTWRRGTATGATQDVMVWVLRAAILGGALLVWSRGGASAGDVAFAVTAFAMLQGYLRSIGQDVRNLQKAVNDMEELALLMEETPERDPAPAAAPPVPRGALGFEGVDYGYEGASSPLFEGLDVTIPAGQRVGLVGRSGSGKTTFVKLLQRLHDVTGGRIVLDGRDIAAMPLGDLRRALAVVAQESVLFHRSLAENIAYASPGASMREIRRAAARAGAAEFIERMPKGYATMVGERGVKLSGGERQRVAIARAFLSDAPVLVMDEATSSLDSESETRVAAAAERLMEGRTTLVIAHRLATVARLDRLLVFDRGRIVEDGTHAELLARPGGIYRKLHETQAGAMAAA